MTPASGSLKGVMIFPDIRVVGVRTLSMTQPLPFGAAFPCGGDGFDRGWRDVPDSPAAGASGGVAPSAASAAAVVAAASSSSGAAARPPARRHRPRVYLPRMDLSQLRPQRRAPRDIHDLGSPAGSRRPLPCRH